MHGPSVCYHDNTGYLILEELRDSDTPPKYLNSGTTVTLQSITTIDGVLLTGATFPIDMPYVPGSNGKYRVKLPETLTQGVLSETIVEADVRVVVFAEGGNMAARFLFRFPTRRRVV